LRGEERLQVDAARREALLLRVLRRGFQHQAVRLDAMSYERRAQRFFAGEPSSEVVLRVLEALALGDLVRFVEGLQHIEHHPRMALGELALDDHAVVDRHEVGLPVIAHAFGERIGEQGLDVRMAGEIEGAAVDQVAAPDVTCSLSFSANTKSLLSSAYAQMELPPGEVLKLDGPATIEGDALLVSVNNHTAWHVSEVAVALTVVKKSGARNPSFSDGVTFNGGPEVLGAMASESTQESEVRPEKKPDVTVIYRMRAAAPPWVTTVFSAPLSLDLAPDEDWHWAIVQARGYPPHSYSGNQAQTTAETNGPAGLPASNQSTLIPGLALPQNSTVALPPNPAVESTTPEPK